VEKNISNKIEKGELPNDIVWVGKIIKDICYNNEQQYFGWQQNNKIITSKKVTVV
jgi:glucuronate isomerase